MGRLVAAVAAMAVLVVPGTARAAEDPAYTLTPMRFDVTVGAADDTPCTITANLFVPRGASAAKPVPAVMGTNGFGGSKADFDALGAAYAARGYAFLAYSGLGFGGSTCKITLDDPDTDGKAGRQLISYLGARDDIVEDAPGDPRVGMIGGSYGGQVQFAVAGVDPRLDTIVPQITWHDLAYSLAPNNADADAPGVAKLDWPTLFFGLGSAQGLLAAFDDPSRLEGCPNFPAGVCPALVGAAVTGSLSPEGTALLRHASVRSYVDRIRIPTFLIQGQSDNLFNLQESLRTYRALEAQGTPVKLLWRSAGHSGGGTDGAESSDSDLEGHYESRWALAWFDHYLKRTGPTPALDFSFLTDWLTPTGNDAAGAVGSAPAYPAGPARTLRLSGTNRLVGDGGAVQAGDARMLAPGLVPLSAGGGVVNPGDKTAEGQATSVSYDLPLDADLDVVGPPSVTVRVDAPTFTTGTADPADDLVLFAKLYDVDDKGARLIRNQVSAARIADPTKPITIELPGIVHRFAKGHTLRLTLSTSELTYRGSLGVGPVTVRTDAGDPGTLTLPTVGAPTGPVASGPGGTTPYGTAAGKRRARKAARIGPRRCVARTLRVRLRAPRTLRSARVVVRGPRGARRVVRVRGKRLRRPVVVRRVPAGTLRVTVTSRPRSGAARRSVRTLRACR